MFTFACTILTGSAEGSSAHPKIINKPNQCRQVEDPGRAEKAGAAAPGLRRCLPVWHGAGNGAGGSAACAALGAAVRGGPCPAGSLQGVKCSGGGARGSDTPKGRSFYQRGAKGTLLYVSIKSNVPPTWLSLSIPAVLKHSAAELPILEKMASLSTHQQPALKSA